MPSHASPQHHSIPLAPSPASPLLPQHAIPAPLTPRSADPRTQHRTPSLASPENCLKCCRKVSIKGMTPCSSPLSVILFSVGVITCVILL
ncbi:hypothetical protein E2C01_094034 [Portunus trituberculatus]|uniref:Uncharacterized protein n=1 Tax=Portunus trituberculatus TaxID=210409 RepID=A0A5B7JWJ5_PORTR|nr:hypothetical protein [Portunus trituberculatus]